MSKENNYFVFQVRLNKEKHKDIIRLIKTKTEHLDCGTPYYVRSLLWRELKNQDKNNKVIK